MSGAKAVQAKASADLRNGLNAKFLSTTVHNLREPARIFSMYAKLLAEDAPVDPEFLKYFQASAAQMQNVLDGISEFAFATTELHFEPNPIPLDLPLSHALVQIQKDSQEKIEIVHSELPAVKGCFDHLTLLFRHLLRNSRENTSHALKICVGAEASEDYWTIHLRDNGSGIEPRYHEKIFEPYFRLHGREKPGTGLGLAVCRSIVEGMGGRIWVESEPGQGAAFSFTLHR